MKTNGNEKRKSDYYIGLDVGTNSIGWAVTDKDYKVLKFKDNAMWGVRLFEEAQTAAERRANRTARRLNQRKHARIELLDLLFDEEIAKIDPSFFMRLKESSLLNEDKTIDAKYPLFNDKNYTDKNYHKEYPTSYHLRNELMKSKVPHDVRLVYLALHHILKSRGHFLFDMELSDDYKTVGTLLDELIDQIREDYNIELNIDNKEKFIEILINNGISITSKKKSLREFVSSELVSPEEESGSFSPFFAIDMLSGATVKFCDLFCDEELKDAEKKSLSLIEDFESNLDQIEEAIGSDRMDIIYALKSVFDSAKLAQMLGNNKYISEAKIEQYNINKSDLKRLKQYVKENAPQKYKEIFTEIKDKTNNYAAYSGKTLSSGDYSCKKQADFCKYLRTALPELEKSEDYSDIYEKIKNDTFLPKLRSSDNSVIPMQLHYKELVKILDNAECYLDFLNKKDESGISVKEKIISLFTFRIPYYVGPLNPESPNAWVVRTDEKIYPWNFEKVVNLKESAEKFILNLTSKCTYTGDDVLPKESLLFEKFTVLNEINLISVNGKKIPVEVKKELFEDLFVKSFKTVTKKAVKNYLFRKGYIEQNDEISGIDDVVKSKLKSYHGFSRIFGCEAVESNKEMIEDIIRSITIFGDEKSMLKKWIGEKYPDLEKEKINAICRLKYKDWGSLSKTFLEEIYSPDENGEAHSIIEMLYTTNCNLMQLLSSDYKFRENAESYRLEKYGVKNNIKEMIEEMYVSPAVKRSIMQTVKIVDEIVDIKKSAPDKIFIEVARDKTEENEKKRTVSRKEKLLELYKSCAKENEELLSSLKAKDEGDLRKDALFLYYTQFGKCMYSGERIELDDLETNYDIDHIFPQSRIKDDSIDNRVLVKKKLNEEKGNKYPINQEWRTKMKPFWYSLKEKGLISDKKYERLTRNTELTDEELSSFVARQLVETRQSTKALADIMKKLYSDNAGTKIVYSKAANISDFRHEYNYIKCREINDLHHAKDAYLNIVVGNVYDTKFTDAFFKNIRSENYSLNKIFENPVPGAWNVGDSFATVRNTMRKNNIRVTRRPYNQKGALFDLQIMSAGKGQLEIKNGKSIEKYGGYNKISGAYFCVVEHSMKKSRVRTIEPVYIYRQQFYEKNQLKYCSDVLGLIEPKIVYPILYTDQLVEFDGKQLYICGRTGNQLLCKHNYQLVVSEDDEKYIKEISKYVLRSKAEKAENGIKIAPNSEISKEKSIKLYQLFKQKLETPIYNRLFGNLLQKINESKIDFEELSLYKQCELLIELLKLFKCDRQSSDLTVIECSKNSGIVLINKSIEKLKTAYIINQSVTGLFETKVDLLKKE